MTLKERCPIIEFKDLGDERGRLVVIEGGQTIPFEIQRVFQAVDKVSAGIIPSTTFLHIAILLSKILKNSRFPVF